MTPAQPTNQSNPVRPRFALSALIVAAAGTVAHAQAVNHAFTYQGKLANSGAPVTGTQDMRFRLYDTAAGGTQQGSTICADNVQVVDGLFTVSLNFGDQFAGNQRYLEIEVRPDAGQSCGVGTGYTLLLPRQELSATPHAAHSLDTGLFGGQLPSFYLNASNMNAGSLADARLTSNIARLNAAQTFTGATTFSSPANSFAGAGAGLTALNASNISTGILADGLLSANIPRLSTSNTFLSTNTFNGFVGINRSAPHTGSEVFGLQNTAAQTGYAGMYIRSSSASGQPFYGYATPGATSWTFLDGTTGAWHLFHGGSERLSVTPAGLLGINTFLPEAMLHVFASSAGTVTADSNSALVIEKNTNTYLSILSPDAAERGILFGQPSSNVDGGIIYNTGGLRGLQFRTGGNTPRMFISSAGNVGIGTSTPGARLDVSGTLALSGSAAFNNPAPAAPFTVASSIKVTSLNSDFLDGLDSSAFLQSIPNPLALSGFNSNTGTIRGTNTATNASQLHYGVGGFTTYSGTSILVSTYGVYGESSATGFSAGVYGRSTRTGNTGGVGVSGFSAADFGYGVRGEANATAASGAPVGVIGIANAATGTGVMGTSTNGTGIYGSSSTNIGINAWTSTGAYAIYAERANGNRGWIGGINEGGWLQSTDGNGLVALTSNVNAAAVYCRNDGGGRALHVDGLAAVRSLEILGGADLAEPFDVASHEGVHAAPGMVVIIDPDRPGEMRISNTAYDSRVAGIISGANGLNPGMVMRAEKTPLADGEHPVAMTGRVWCYADATDAAITPGIRLTTSAIPGHAQAVTDSTLAPGAVIGKAMTSLPKGERGMIMVLVNLQ